MNTGQTQMRAIINLSTERYWPGQVRLAKSIQEHVDIRVILWCDEAEVDALPHLENNYSFKPLCFKRAYELGIRYILWLDASMVVIKDLTPIFDIIERDGYFFQDSGWMNDRWTNAKAKDYFSTDEGHMLSSGVLGLDMDSEVGNMFWQRWQGAMHAGIFNGSHTDHRHDQTAASLIAHNMGLKLQAGNTFMVYGKEDEPTISDMTVLRADGIAF